MKRVKIEARDVRLRAGETEILKGVTTSIPEHEIFTIIGPSGAGKSSFLRTLNRLHEISGGEILLDGVPIRRIDPRELRRRMGMVFQIPLAFEGTVEDNLMMGPRLNSLEIPDLGELMEMVGLPPSFLKQKASELSVGEQQRMCIARAIANQPDVLLMDEPTASLDQSSVRMVENLITELKNTYSLTLVVVTHDIRQAKHIGDWTMLMREGRSIVTMPTSEFFEKFRIEEVI